VSPILMRPVREQLEHDRVIRLLQVKWRRRYQVAINPGNEQTSPVGPSTAPLFPDLVFFSQEHGRRLEGVVEVETAESTNNMEALSEWAPFARLRAPFYLYVPNGSVDNARRLIAENHIVVAEIWTYYLVGDQMRFTMVHRPPPAPRSRVAVQPQADAARPRPGRSRAATTPRRKPAAGRARTAKAVQPARKRPRPAKKVARPASRTQKRK